VIFVSIIFYFCKNSGIIGGFLPMLLFLWILIEENNPSGTFWFIYFLEYAFSIMLIFYYTIKLDYSAHVQAGDSFWWYPLFDTFS
jgi:hypothetical protein